MNEGKRLKTHREKKNYRGHLDYIKRKAERNVARPKQRFLGLNPETGLGLGWIRE
jgi:hypothetical protein